LFALPQTPTFSGGAKWVNLAVHDATADNGRDSH
jgi:hypothetical protein